MVYILSVFSSSKCSLFHNYNVFGSCFIHILYTGVLKFKKNNSCAKRLREQFMYFPSAELSERQYPEHNVNLTYCVVHIRKILPPSKG